MFCGGRFLPYLWSVLDVVSDVVFEGGSVSPYRWPALNVVSGVLFGSILSYRIAGSPYGLVLVVLFGGFCLIRSSVRHRSWFWTLRLVAVAS